MVNHIRICALFICLGVLGSYSMAGGGVVSPLQGMGEIPFSADLPVFYPEFGPAQVNLARRAGAARGRHRDAVYVARERG